MLNLGKVVSTVQANCDISDAKHAGNYSMCSFLLKMREYFRWENDLPLSCRLPKDEIGDWLVSREQSWEQLESNDYQPVPLTHGSSDPFDDAAINAELVPRGYVYSSGYGLFSKPHFFVGSLHRHEECDGATVYVSSCEYARDLVAPPAMARENRIFVRQESVRRFVWEKIEEWYWRKRPDTPLARALAAYGAKADAELDADAIEALLDRITENETETMVLHELGELRAGHLLDPGWHELLSDVIGSKAEFVMRAVRDHLADALVTLPRLVEERNEASLHFYFANFTGMRKTLYPEALAAYQQWIENQRIQPLAELCASGAEYWQATARRIAHAGAMAGNEAGPSIEALFDAQLRT